MEIAYLVKRVQSSLKHNKSVFEIRGDLERMAFVGRELQKRIAGTSAEHAASLAGSLITVAERATKTDAPTPRDVDLLIHLAAAIRHAFVTDAEFGRGGNGDQRDDHQVHHRQDVKPAKLAGA